MAAPTPSERPRAADGRFVRRRQRAEERTEGAGPIALLTLAIIVGIAGFAFHLLWVGALVLLGVLWGSLAAERQRRSRNGKGVIAEVVDVVVEQAKDLADSAQSKSTEGTRDR